MRRPKHTKIALSTPAPVARSTARELELSSSERVINVSSDDVVLTTKTIDFKRMRGVVPQEATMSGALAPEEKAPARAIPVAGRKRPVPSRIVRAGEPNKAIEALKARRDAAMGAERRDHVQIPSSQYPGDTLLPKPPTEGRRDLTATERILEAEDGISRSGVETAQVATHLTGLEKSPPRGRELVRSPVLISEGYFGAGGPVLATPLKVQATPRVASSVLGFSNMKRRARQPSLLRLVQAHAKDQSDDEDDDYDDSLNDFCPDDESTPFLNSKSYSGLQLSPSLPAALPAQTPSSRKRKRPSPEVEVPMSQSLEPRLVSSPPRSSPPAELELDEDLYNVSPPNAKRVPEPLLPLPRQRRTTTPPSDLRRSTPAPPHSSSFVPVSHTKSAVPEPKTPRPITSASAAPLSPSPCQSSSPVVATSRTLKPLSTATLQNLLPRRRLRQNPRHRGTFDIPSSSLTTEIDTADLDDDEDELGASSKIKVRLRRNRDTLAGKGKANTIKGVGAAGKKKASSSRRNDKAKGGITTKTYTRKQIAIEEQDHGVDENTDPEGDEVGNEIAAGNSKAPSGELKSLARKFKEVDQWELEIEEVTGSGSSQVDSR